MKRPSIQSDPISFGAKRAAEMVAYSQRHYGDSTARLHPKAIVLHYTAGGTYESVWSLFESDAPNVNEKPGTVTHFIIDRDGTIYQLLALDMRGRHTIGLNYVALGIEFVQESGDGDSWATNQILHRRAQIASGLELVRWLQHKFDIADRDVIGHGTANDSHFFTDLEGWKNTHVDWGSDSMHEFRSRLKGGQ